jgi:Acyl-CoA dehydrogenase, C-terminal domain
VRFEFNQDQTTFTTFLEQMLGSDEGAFRTTQDWGRHEYGTALDAQLDKNGFFDVAAEDTLGPVMAAEMIFQIAQLPVTIESAASALLRPFLVKNLPRPIAVIDGDPTVPIRFLPVARSVIWISDTGIRTTTLQDGDVETVESLFAYPMGKIDATSLNWSPIETDPAHAFDLWRIGLAAELTGAMKGAHDSVLEHVREREQFGRPLGSFQAVQHRLADNVIQIDAARLLVLKAAFSEQTFDATIALGHTQNMATKITYDLHQFMGAMGLTLEHPLHRWTYRARLLRAALGGPSKAYGQAADARWGAA